MKPANILVHGGKIRFTDFGLSVDFTSADGSTTLGVVKGLTPVYCAPEVAQYMPRNTGSDIWSLGVVFLEMSAVLKGKAVGFVPEFLQGHGLRNSSVRANASGLRELLATLQESGERSDDRALDWCREMLQEEQHLRPTATKLTTLILDAEQSADSNPVFCGTCCMSPYDDDDDDDDNYFSDAVDDV